MHGQERNTAFRKRVFRILVLRLPAPPQGIEERVEEGADKPAFVRKRADSTAPCLVLKPREVLRDKCEIVDRTLVATLFGEVE